MDNIKNKVFIENSLDPTNNKYVKKIFVKKVSKKTGNDIWYMEWEYFSNRGNYSVSSVYKTHVGKEVRVIYRGDSKIYNFVIPKEEKPLE